MALNVNKTDLLVVTAGSALQNYPWWTSRELRRTSGSHFPRVWILDLIFGNLGSPFWAPKRQKNGFSRWYGWIGAAKLPLVDLPRAPTDVWEPFSELSNSWNHFWELLGTVLTYPGSLRSFLTSSIDSARPNGSWHTKREFGSSSETQFRSFL